MSNILVTLQKTPTPLPGAAAFAKTNLVVTDSAGVAQNGSVDGTESSPWALGFQNLADGTGSVVATDVDVNGATLGSPITQAFTTAPAGGQTFPATTGITVTAA